MCNLCEYNNIINSNEYTKEYIEKYIYKFKYFISYGCNNTHIPKELIYLKSIILKKESLIYTLPNTLINLKLLIIKNSKFNKLPKELINIRKLKISNCENNLILPKEYINLNQLKIKHCNNINYLPCEYINLKYLKLKHDMYFIDNLISNIPNTYISLRVLKMYGRYNILKLSNTYLKLHTLVLNFINEKIVIPNTYNSLKIFSCEFSPNLDINFEHILNLNEFYSKFSKLSKIYNIDKNMGDINHIEYNDEYTCVYEYNNQIIEYKEIYNYYIQNIKKVIILQKFFKCKIKYFKLIKIIPLILEIYFTPGYKGYYNSMTSFNSLKYK